MEHTGRKLLFVSKLKDGTGDMKQEMQFWECRREHSALSFAVFDR